MGMEGGNVGSQGFRECVTLFVRECIWNALVVLGFPPRWVVYHSSGSTPMTASRFFVGNREAELKPTTFSSLLRLRVFLTLFFSCRHSDIAL